MRRAAKRDANETAIKEALRAAGASVSELSDKAIPDLLVGFGENYLMEVKGEGGVLTPAQQEWHKSWRGKVAIVRTIDEALRVIGVIE